MSTHAPAGAHRAQNAARHAATQPWLEALERFGYVVRGVVYALMGSLALGLAMSRSGAATDPAGSVVLLAGSPLGPPLLIAVVVGLGAYSIWGFVRAIFDPWRHGSGPTGIAQRLGYAWSGFAYASLTLFALNLLAGGGRSATDGTQAAVRSILTLPAGKLVAVAIGVVTIGVGIGQFAGAQSDFLQRGVKEHEMPPAVRKLSRWLGRLGMFSRGITFTLVGWFVLQAGLHRDPSGAHGYRGAFIFLLSQPYGHLFLAVVALGFIALGLHSLALARWARLLGSS
jgi:hypothetical protein